VSATVSRVSSPASVGSTSPEIEIEKALHLVFGSRFEFETIAAARKRGDTGGNRRVERQFAILPNSRSPRWLLPLASRCCTLRAFDEVRVFAPGAKMIRSGLKLVAAMGALPRVAQTTSVPVGGGLVDRIAQLIGQPEASFVVTIGTPSRFRKLTVAVMDREGKLIAFVKVPMTKEAATRVAQEGEVLESLAQTRLASIVPRVLFRGEWNEQSVLCLSAGPAQASAMQFGPEHRALLHLIWSVQARDREGEELVNDVAGRVAAVNTVITPEAAKILAEALERAHAELRSASVACGLSHGDFAPWNLRSASEGLFAFDWESAAWDAPNLWDIAHYDTQLVTLLGRKSRFREITQGMAFSKGSYLLYLAQIIAATVRELGASSPHVNDRVRLLKNSLES
jgi:hypothetical protein